MALTPDKLTNISKNCSIRNKKPTLQSRNGCWHVRDSPTFPIYFTILFVCLNSGNLASANGDLADEPLNNTCETFLPECQCDYFDVVVSLVCQNVRDFGVFTKTLEDESLFEKGIDFDISLSGAALLPRHFLSGLSVYRLLIDDPRLEDIEDGAFDGVRLRRFQVWSSSIKKIPNFQPLRHSLRHLNLDNSLLTSIEGDQLQNMTLLEIISFINNTIHYVAPDAFQGTENVIIFDISNNYLQSLPPNLFDPWKKVRKVVISNNQLLHVDRLFAVTHPQFLFLDHNNLTDLDAVLHPNMSRAEKVSLSYNFFTKVTNNSFNGKITNTRFLYLDHCQIRQFDAQHYADLRSLSYLDLSYNLIEKVVKRTVAFGKHAELDLTGNRIEEFDVLLSYTVKRLYLNKNFITNIGQNMKFGQLTVVSIADNRIQSLEKDAFKGNLEISLMDLQGNPISSIERGTFAALKRDLIYLDLSRNKLPKLNGCVRGLYLLTVLNLTDNRIERFEVNEFQGLNELTELYLDKNRIQTLGQELQRLINLKSLIISNNNIRTIRANELPINLQQLYIEGNPLQCDCEMLPFLQELNSTKRLMTDVSLCMPSNNSLSLSPVLCPDGCQCFCTSETENHYIFVDCRFAGLTKLPSLFTATKSNEINSLSFSVHLPRRVEVNALHSQNYPFIIRDEIRGLDFSHNNMESVADAHLPEATEHLFLAHNHFKEPPVSLLHSLGRLKTLTLSGNPWACDCRTSNFKRWILTHSRLILDANETRCGPDVEAMSKKFIWTLTDFDLCPTGYGKYVTIALGVLCFLVVAATFIIVWYRYKTNINMWLYIHGLRCIKEKYAGPEKAYDVFIAFSGDDEKLIIEELMNVMEEKGLRTICSPEMNFPKSSLDTSDFKTIRKIRQCKQTIIVLTRNFLESESCMYQFDSAYLEGLIDLTHRIIIIRVGDVPEVREMPEVVQTYLKRSTCLTWQSQNFRSKLSYYLPDTSSDQGVTKNDRPSFVRVH